MPAFNLQHVRSLAPQMWEEAGRMCQALTDHIGQSGEERVLLYEWVSTTRSKIATAQADRRRRAAALSTSSASGPGEQA